MDLRPTGQNRGAGRACYSTHLGSLFEVLDASSSSFVDRVGTKPGDLGVDTIRMARYFVENIGGVSAARCVSIRYEDLCQQPDAAMSKIMDFLCAKPTAIRSYQDSIEPRPPKILPEVKKRYDRTRQQLVPYLKHHSYELEPQWISGK